MMDFTETETRPAVYCGTYAKYNDGSIAGKWLYLEDYSDSEAFFKACAELHKDEDDPEYMFQDFEGIPKEFYSESMSTSDADKIYEFLALDERDREIVTEYADATGYSFNDFTFDDAIDSYFTELDTNYSGDSQNRELGDYILNEGLFGVDIPEALQGYIDAEAIGRDWMYDMSVSSNGFVFTNN